MLAAFFQFHLIHEIPYLHTLNASLVSLGYSHVHAYRQNKQAESALGLAIHRLLLYETT